MSNKPKESNTLKALGLTEDEYFEKLKYYVDNRKEIEHQNRKKEYEKKQIAIGEKLSNLLYAGKVLKENGYSIYNIYQANEDFRKIMKLDEITEIAGVYQTHKIDKNKKVHIKDHIVTITKQNFYNAFYRPIWDNLTTAEKIKSLEWMFETINRERHLGIKDIKYFPDDTQSVDYLGFFRKDDNYLFINLNNLQQPSAYLSYPHVIAHELMHARQVKYSMSHNSNKITDFYTLSQTILGTVDYQKLTVDYSIDEATEIALYRTSLSEKVADLQALKTLKRYIKLNNEQFGKRKTIELDFNNHIDKCLFDKTTQRKVNGKTHFEATDSILTNEEIVLKGQHEFLLKLLLLKAYYENETAVFTALQEIKNKDLNKLEEQYKKGAVTLQEYTSQKGNALNILEKCKKYVETGYNKLDLIKSTFKQTLKTGLKPQCFDEKQEFKPLNLIDEPKQKYSLPRWLHELEDKNRKNIESQKKRFGIIDDNKSL